MDDTAPFRAHDTAPLRFDGRVAIVTGAGRNLGRAYARLLAARGAKVVVNDIGVGISDTDGATPAPAMNPGLAVVEEIRAAGGEAVLNTDTIATPDGGASIVATALDTWGTVDIVINNAGVVRQGSIDEMPDEFVQAMLQTHIAGAMNVTRPAWAVMKAKGFGRVCNVSSGAGVTGIANMAVYSAVKLGVVGLARAQAIEGAPHGIKVNVVAPFASVRGNDFGPVAWSPKLAEWLHPDQVAPLAAFLVHDDCPVTGEYFTVGGGWVGRVQLASNTGWSEHPLSLEALRDDWDAVMGEASDFRLVPAGGNAWQSARMMQGFR
jgi:NAD(P)-dependent dehydrogenase (short-subunit alcohol dehydrogenase family)